MQVQRVRDSHPIVTEGEAGDAWYVIFRGTAEVSKEGPFTAPRVIASLGPRDCFGEMAILDGSPRSATVKARGDVTVFRFPRGPFQELLGEGNLGAYKLVHELAKVLCQRQRALNAQLGELLERGPTERPAIRRRIGPLLDSAFVSD
jgi:CRP-like cAMP-binding protein